MGALHNPQLVVWEDGTRRNLMQRHPELQKTIARLSAHAGVLTHAGIVLPPAYEERAQTSRPFVISVGAIYWLRLVASSMQNFTLQAEMPYGERPKRP